MTEGPQLQRPFGAASFESAFVARVSAAATAACAGVAAEPAACAVSAVERRVFQPLLEGLLAH